MKAEPTNIKSIFKKAPISAIMTIIFFVAFIGIYLLLTIRSVEPHYIMGLLFVMLTFFLGTITYLTVKEELTKIASSVITVLLAVIFSTVMFFGVLFISIDAATTSTTDIDRYERVLRLTGYPEGFLTKHFPDEIPADARDIVFHYNPAFLQGGEEIRLQYKTNQELINDYVSIFSTNSKWVGKPGDSEAGRQGIITGVIDLSEDFTIYLIDSEPYKPDNWNHGKLSLVAISEESSTIIFYADDW